MPDNSNYQFRAVPLNLVEYVTKKTKSSAYYFRYLLDRTLMMFEYKNLPETIDGKVLERYLQVNGVACITKATDGNLYCFNGSWGGAQDVYYRPTKFIIANPHISQLKEETFTKECTIYGTEEHDGVLMRNDTEWASLTPLIGRYAVLMCENTLTVRTADIMLRIIALLSAGTDKALKSAEAYIRKLENGELSVIGDSAFMETLKLQSPPSNNGSYLTQFIELQQYLKGSFFNELGLRANYNMKREAIGQGESTLDADSILPLCDNMLSCRKEDIAKVNELFGTDISVDFSSAWLENRVETTISMVSQLTESGLLDHVGANEPSVMEMGDASMGDIDSNGAFNTETGNVKEGDNSNDENKYAVDGDGTSSKENGRNGDSSERSGNEDSEDREPSERGISEEGRRGEEASEEGSDKVSEEEVDEVRDELRSDELTVVEAVNEIVEDAISRLTAEARNDGEGGEDGGISEEEVSETEGLSTSD